LMYYSEFETMVLFALRQWVAADVAVFSRIDNTIGEGKLYFRVGTT